MMPGLLSKFLSLTLALLMVGATGVCACGNTHACGLAMVKKETKPTCPKHCEKSSSQKDPTQSSPSHQCPGCKVTSNLDRPAANPVHAAISILSATLLLAPLPMVIQPVAEMPVAIAHEDIPSPPLLCDLFHSFCLLTI